MAMRILTLFLAVLIAAVASPLAEAGETKMISFMPAWTVSETAKYLVKRSRTHNHRRTRSANMTLTVRAVGKMADGYIFECQYDNFDTDIDIPYDSKRILVEANRGVRIKYSTDRYGRFQRIINLDEIKVCMEASLARYFASIPDEVVRASVSKHINDHVKIEGAVSAGASEDIAYLHNPYFLGMEFEAGEKYMAEVTLPNILNPPQPYLGVVSMMASRDGGFKQMIIEQEVEIGRAHV